MANCLCTGTTYTFPTPTTGFNSDLEVQRGGIYFLAFAKCDFAGIDETDLTEWNAAIAAGNIIALRSCFNQAELANDVQTEEIGACRRTIVSRSVNTLTITDLVDNPDHDRFKFWRSLQRVNSVQVAFGTCDQKLFGFRTASVTAGFSIGETTADKASWTINLSWDDLESDLPVVPSPANANFIDAITIPA